MKIKLTLLLSLIILSSCDTQTEEVKSGEVKAIPLTSNYFVGTDSTIVIINKDDGRILNVIKRK